MYQMAGWGDRSIGDHVPEQTGAPRPPTAPGRRAGTAQPTAGAPTAAAVPAAATPTPAPTTAPAAAPDATPTTAPTTTPAGARTAGRPALRRTARRPRLSDAETEQRMLDSGVRMVAERGLSLSLEHLSMEDLIQDAGVSRTSSYRRWPTKDLFAADLLLRLARATDLPADLPDGLPELTGDLAALGAHAGDLAQAGPRRDVVVAVLRITVGRDFDAMLRSPAWRNHVALRAAHLGLPDGDLRVQVAAALRDTERRFTERRAAVFAALGDLIGYRLTVPDARGWQRLSLTLGAVATGLLVRGYADPEAVTATTRATPFGSSTPADWSEATLASVGVLLGAIEPDPAIVWDAERTAVLRAHLRDPDAALRALLAAAEG
jgi:AcrR family transcriptional regulator